MAIIKRILIDGIIKAMVLAGSPFVRPGSCSSNSSAARSQQNKEWFIQECLIYGAYLLYHKSMVEGLQVT